MPTRPLADWLRLDGRTAVVTGGGAGIGRGIALRLAEQGAGLAVFDLDGGAAERTASEARALGVRALGLACDVGSEAQVVEALARVRDEDWAAPAILVNSAGIVSAPGQPFTRNTEADWDLVLAVNVKGMFFTCKAVAEDVAASGCGRIVNIASITGVISAPYLPPYTVSKAAVISLTKVIARDLAPRGATANAVCPGYVWTAIWEKLGAAAFEERIAALVPMKRPQTIDDVAVAVAFLCSDAAANITGQVLGVDGGVTI